MTSPPRLPRVILRALLPRHEISEAVEGDLHQGFARRAAESTRRAALWYWGQVLSLPYLSLNRQVRRLERARRPAITADGGGWMGGVAMDLRIALRTLLRRPAFTIVSVMTLALSIGAATLFFSVMEGVLLKPLPYEEPDDLVTIFLTSDEWRQSDNELLRNSWDIRTMELRHAEAWREASTPLSSVGVYVPLPTTLDTGDGSDETEEVIQVDEGLFPTLGVSPAMGRLPSTEEIRRGDPVAVLRHTTWMTRFGGDPEVLGRTFRIGTQPYDVIGVMPPGFYFPLEPGSDLWVPVMEEAREWPAFYGIGRLGPDASVEDAGAALERITRRLGEEDPAQAGLGARTAPHLDIIVDSAKRGIQLLFGTGVLVVLVACVNLGNMVLARGASRRDELAVRAALGGSRGSLVSTVFSEILIIGIIGGATGVTLAALALDPFVESLSASMRQLPRSGSVGLNGTVLLFAAAATLATAATAGLGPALAAARRAPAGILAGVPGAAGGRSGERGQRTLLALQAVLTVVLVSGAGLLARSFIATLAVDTGIDAEQVAVLHIQAVQQRFPDAGELAPLRSALLERASGLRGVTVVSLADALPSYGGASLLPVRPEGARPDATREVIVVSVGPEYFTATGIPVLSGGRPYLGESTDDRRRAAISEELARRLFGSVDAVGRTFLLGSDPLESGDHARSVEVAAVVGESRQLSVLQPPMPTLYLPVGERGLRSFFLLLRHDGEPGTVLEAARAAMLQVSPRIRIASASVLGRHIRAGLRHLRLRMILMLALAGLACLLALVGIAGVVAHYLSEQSREVGIRMALGADAHGEVARVVRHALKPTVLGLAVGVLVAVTASRVMESFLVGIETTDPATYAVVTGLLLIMATLAAWIPARRTAAVDPARVLKQE